MQPMLLTSWLQLLSYNVLTIMAEVCTVATAMASVSWVWGSWIYHLSLWLSQLSTVLTKDGSLHTHYTFTPWVVLYSPSIEHQVGGTLILHLFLKRLMSHISDLMSIIRWNTNIFTIIKREIGKLKTQWDGIPIFSQSSKEKLASWKHNEMEYRYSHNHEKRNG